MKEVNHSATILQSEEPEELILSGESEPSSKSHSEELDASMGESPLNQPSKFDDNSNDILNEVKPQLSDKLKKHPINSNKELGFNHHFTRFLGAMRAKTFYLLAITIIAAIAVVSGLGVLGFDQIAQWLAIAMLGLFALVGITSIFAYVTGIMNFSSGKASNLYLGSVLDQYTDAIALADLVDGSVEFGNDSFKRLSRSENSRRYAGVTEIFSEDEDFQAALYRVSTNIKNGERGVDTVRIVDTKNSGFFTNTGSAWVRISAYPVQVEENKSIAVWRFEDITKDSIDHEDSFSKLSATLAFLDKAPLGLMTINNDGNVVYANDTICSWLDLPSPHIPEPKLPLFKLINGPMPKSLDISRTRKVNKSEVQNNVRFFDLTLHRKNNNSIDVRVVAQKTYNDTGVQLGQQLIILERSAAAAMAGSGELGVVANQLFETAPLGLSIVAQNGRISYVNPQFNDLFNSPDLFNQRLVDIVPEDVRFELAEALAEANNSNNLLEPIAVRRERGKGRSVYLHIVPIESDPQGGSRIAVYASDMTEHFELEQQFAQSQRVQAIGQLAGGIAHDFNNLLTAIMGFADLVTERLNPRDKTFQDVKRISENAKHASELVSHLLTFSRKQKLSTQITDFNSQMLSLRSNLNRLIGPRVNLDVNLGRDLWPIKVDRNQLDHVLMNLSVNARDAMPTGGHLTMATKNVKAGEINSLGYPRLKEQDYVLCEVSDDGSGIPSADLDKIFEPFYTTKETGRGTGLGLSTVYGFIKQSGGFIFVESEVGKGTKFLIFLPRCSADAAMSDNSNVSQSGQPENEISTGPTLRVIDTGKNSKDNTDQKASASNNRDAIKVVFSSEDNSAATNRFVPLESEVKSQEYSKKGVGNKISKAKNSQKSTDMTGKGTVLLVEDEEAVRLFSSRALRSRGYNVLEAVNGAEAIEILDSANGKIDLLVSDVLMPEMDGPTMYKKMLKKYPDLDVIFVSGYSKDAFDQFDDDELEFKFLGKPYSFRELVALVKETIESKDNETDEDKKSTE